MTAFVISQHTAQIQQSHRIKRLLGLETGFQYSNLQRSLTLERCWIKRKMIENWIPHLNFNILLYLLHLLSGSKVGITGNSGAQPRNCVIFYSFLSYCPSSHLSNEELSSINSSSVTLSCSHTINAPLCPSHLPLGCNARCLPSSIHSSIFTFPNNRAYHLTLVLRILPWFFIAHKIKFKFFPLTNEDAHHFAPICLIIIITDIKCPSLC